MATNKKKAEEAAVEEVTVQADPAMAQPKMTLEDVQKQIMEMLAAAEEKANAIVAKAEEAAAKINPHAMTDEEKAEALARGEELVTVKLFKDNHKYKDDVFVAVNGETIAIKRGVEVQIKRKFAEVLENSSLQDYETSLLIEQKSGQFAADTEKFMK